MTSIADTIAASAKTQEANIVASLGKIEATASKIQRGSYMVQITLPDGTLDDDLKVMFNTPGTNEPQQLMILEAQAIRLSRAILAKVESTVPATNTAVAK